MHRLVLGNPFAALVAPIILCVLAHKLLNKRRASARGDAGDPKPGASTSMDRPMERQYDVFLSFRGTDTRQSFTSHLYAGLMDAGVHVYRDDDELRVGDRVDSRLLEAIENSKILIPIISLNYASSSWCLRELVHMMDCKKRLGHRVLPLFYKVEPADVEHLTGGFGEAFQYYHSGRNFDQKLVEEWKQALREVSSLSGFESDFSREAEWVQWIVLKVLIELKNAVEFDLVGMDYHVEEITKLLTENSDAVLYVGIYGMGGVGKTTLAQVIFNRFLTLFEHRSFIRNCRESFNRNGMVAMQSQLICDILGQILLNNTDEGVNFISSRFRHKKVLIVLDDVDDYYQLMALAGHREWFAPGSWIIVTTRDKSILHMARADIMYELGPMSEEESLILFSRHAFLRDSPPTEFETLSRHLVSITSGLPLLLKAVGSLLYGKRREAWTDTIEKMQRLPPSDVQDMLMISYEALERDQKQMFLDIACFLTGSDARVASYMWDACGFYTRVGIEVLRFLSFIDTGDNHEFRMHDQLRYLGRQIVCQESISNPNERSRLWAYEEALSVLERNRGTDMIQAICMERYDETRFAYEGSHTFTDEQFKNLTSLRFLHMSDVKLVGDFKEIFSQLRWLKWWNCSPAFAAENFHPRELVILDLSGSLILDDWGGWSSMMMAKKLRVLNLTGCCSLRSTFYLSAFQSLEILILRDCGELEKIHPCIGDVKTLIFLDLRGCLHLKELPPQMSKLEQLKELLLDETMIQEIPSFVGSLKKLEMLSAKGCRSLLRLPDSIGRMGNLRRLSLGCCHQLREIPNSIGKLELLTQLDLSWTGITELPESLWDLQNLEVLDFCHSGIEKLPDVFRRLKSSERKYA